MDLAKMAKETLQSHKFQGVEFSGGLTLAPDQTLDYRITATAKGNINTPGNSEQVLVNTFQFLRSLGNSPQSSSSSEQPEASQG